MPSPHLIGFPVVVEQAVAWGDMDSFGHVNNVVFFRYFENARVEYLARVGWFALLTDTGVGPIVASAQARFRRPLAHPDRLHVGARIIDVQADRVTFEHRLVSEKWADVAADGQAVVVCFDYRGNAKAPLPHALRDRIDALERGS